MTEQLNNIVPWYCHICGGEFDIPDDGGICSICLEPTCRSCLWRTYGKDPTTGKRRLRFVCTSCRKTAASRVSVPGEAAMKTPSVIWGVVFLLCLIAFPVIEYAGGRLCMPLIVPPLFPAQIVPVGIGLLAGIKLVNAVVRSLTARQHRVWTLGALAIVIAATGAFWLCAPHLPGFLHGLRDRFVAKVGYTGMREFAKEVCPNGKEVIIAGPGKWSPATPERQKQWDDLRSRYPFLRWTFGRGVVVARDGIVSLTWGSPLTGHWGFHLSPAGRVEDPEERRRRILRVSEDILFVYYSD
jgi:hypothetical protein